MTTNLMRTIRGAWRWIGSREGLALSLEERLIKKLRGQTEWVSRFLMELRSMKDTIKMVCVMGTEEESRVKEKFIKAHSKMTKWREKDSLLGLMGEYTRVSGLAAKSTESVNTFGLMGKFTMENSKMTIVTVKPLFIIPTVKFLLGCGETG